MTPAQRQNLQRLLNPRRIALIGGRDAETVARECARIGFRGPIWPVNPKRDEIGGHPCFRSIADLPAVPDAVFLAIPRDAAIAAVAALRDIGAGGVVCYTAGFGETGEDGRAAEAALIEAAGDLALVGPNCYGILNYLDRVALWPFAHGRFAPRKGVAIITQSGMLSSDLTMSQRALPLAFMVSCGNQAVLGLEDFVDTFAEHPRVDAIGLHIESLKDLPRFAEAVDKALRRGVPIVALKSGSSEIGRRLTVTHTGSLSGEDDLYDALFDRFGLIRVRSPQQMLETLKLLSIAGVPQGTRVAGFTCSGGGAALLADHAEAIGLAFPQPSAETTARLEGLLPATASVTNPLDYTTPIWGMPERTGPVFAATLSDPYDAALLVQDYPLPGLDDSKASYLKDAEAFIAAARAADLPAAVCSTLPENIDRATRDHLAGQGVAPLQGVSEAMNAIAGAAWYGARRKTILADPPATVIAAPAAGDGSVLLDEFLGKHRLGEAGIPIPEGRRADGAGAAAAAGQLGFPVALKMLSPLLPHKTEAGAVALGLTDAAQVETGVAGMRRSVEARAAAAVTDSFLVERMVAAPLAELLVNLRRDPQFGPVMTLASGGTLVELVGDAVTLLLPASRAEIERHLLRLKVARLLDGYRGRAAADRGALLDCLCRLARILDDPSDPLEEVEINPLFLLSEGVVAVDVVMRVAASPCSGRSSVRFGG